MLTEADNVILDRARQSFIRLFDTDEETLFLHLLKCGVLTDADRRRIKGLIETQTKAAANSELLAVYARQADRLDHLKEALRQSCYHNLVKQLTPSHASIDNAQQLLNAGQIRELLTIGNVPRLPEVYVERQSLLNNLREALLDIGNEQEGGWVVVHGMIGSGKSVLASAILRDPQITGQMYTRVFWVTLDRSGGDDTVRKALQDLYCKADRGGGGYDRTVGNIEGLVCRLQNLFLYDLPKSLIILDDACTERAVRLFDDIRCRFLVTTQNRALVDVINSKKHHVAVPASGFTMEEGLRAFSQWLKIDPKKLPPEARQIIETCQGHPFQISLVGSLLKERNDRWKYYCDQIHERNLTSIKKQTAYGHQNFHTVALISLESLQDEQKLLFRSLSVFHQNARIPVKVLMVFWDKSKEEIEDIMETFKKQSLIIVDESQNGACEMYSIHSLLHQVLKMVEKDRRQEHHETFLKRYLSVAKNNWHDFPNDGYIYRNIGYHLFRASADLSRFASVYLNLHFVIMKLLCCGAVSMLADYNRYRQFIAQKDFTVVDEFQQFVTRNIHFINEAIKSQNGFGDILQLALTQPESVNLHRQATAIRDAYPHYAVDEGFKTLSRDTNNFFKCIISFRHHEGAVNYAQWLCTDDAFVSAGTDQTIRIGSVRTGHELRKKITLRHAATHICVAPDAGYVLACCNEALEIYDLQYANIYGLINLEKFAVSPDLEYDRTPSPLWRSYDDLHKLANEASSEKNLILMNANVDSNADAFVEPYDAPQRRFTVDENVAEKCEFRCCDISQDGKNAVSGDDTFCVRLWNLENGHRQDFIGHNGAVNCCKFFTWSSHAYVVSCSDDGTCIIWNVGTENIEFQFREHSGSVSSCCPITAGCFAGCILSMDEHCFKIWSWRKDEMDYRVEWQTGDERILSVDVSHCGNYVAAGLSDFSILTWKLEDMAAVQMAVLRGHAGAVHSVRFSDCGERLLSSSEDSIVQVWNIKDIKNATRQIANGALILG